MLKKHNDKLHKKRNRTKFDNTNIRKLNYREFCKIKFTNHRKIKTKFRFLRGHDFIEFVFRAFNKHKILFET